MTKLDELKANYDAANASVIAADIAARAAFDKATAAAHNADFAYEAAAKRDAAKFAAAIDANKAAEDAVEAAEAADDYATSVSLAARIARIAYEKELDKEIQYVDEKLRLRALVEALEYVKT